MTERLLSEASTKLCQTEMEGSRGTLSFCNYHRVYTDRRPLSLPPPLGRGKGVA